MAALWMARTGIRTLVVERNSGPTKAGHADGLESRTIEILDSFDLGQKVWNESNHTIDICLWVTTILFGRCHSNSHAGTLIIEQNLRGCITPTEHFGQFEARVVAVSGVHPRPVAN
jgi:2-polyprenyl-6-methoxyphenol hydroxylase-like FAD-dependent oxidoreductase